MASREEAPKVNAGSMADIAFLLLIFFLVTTSIATDVGLDRKLPGKSTIHSLPIAQRNILPVLINEKGDLLVDNELVDLKNLRSLTTAFLDNGGASKNTLAYCDYCLGKRDQKSSDNPEKAIVSLMSSRKTSYGVYITVQNELVGAYNDLRNREAQRLFKTDFTTMEEAYLNPETSENISVNLIGKIKKIQNLYPMKLSEAERN